VVVRPACEADRAWISELLEHRWGSTVIFRCQRSDDASRLPALVAEERGRPAGVATYRVEPPECEVVTLDALTKWTGVGTALLRAVEEEARRAGCGRVWLVTTNDNVDALRFYQRRGYRIAAINVGAVEEARRSHKPSIPSSGCYGVPIRDEIVLEKELA